VAIYTTGGISDGHLNPTISITLSVFRGFPARRTLIYVAAQLLGAITAGGIAYAIYHDAILGGLATEKVPQSKSVTAEALVTAPKQFVHPATAFFTEFIGSAILVGVIMALGDDNNAPPGAGMNAFVVGVLISIVVLALGYNTGGYVTFHPSQEKYMSSQITISDVSIAQCFNCARDFGPRLVALMAGWGGQLFRETHAWWVWGPWCADISGDLFGALIYDALIFTGGESLVNYPRRRRKRALRVRSVNLRKKLGIGRKKARDLEKTLEED
jgi:aquaglyceroporin related protein